MSSDAMAAMGAGGYDPELVAMQQEADLLGLIQEDTREQGHESGNRIAFKKCPICGHEDDFYFYPSSNTWACFSASNANANDKGRDGGGYLKYLLRTGKASDNDEAVKMLREATGHKYEGSDDGEPISKTGSNAGAMLLPRWDAIHAADPPERAPALIDGILRCGHVGLISGKAKAGKSWAALQLAVAVATGGEWLGRFRCKRGRILFIDPELDPRSLEGRMHRVCEATGASYDEVEARVSKWCLRGTVTTKGEPPTIRDLAHDLSKAGERFDLIIIDSASCFLAGDENSSRDVRAFTNQVLRICESTGAAALIVQHMGKGLAGDRDAADRARGSSVWADAPDVTMTITETFPPSGEPSDHLGEGERALLLECAGIREFPSFDPVRLIYGYPVHRLDVDGITDDWKPATSTGNGGKESGKTRQAVAVAKASLADAALLAHMYAEGITDPEALTVADAAQVVGESLGEPITKQTLRGYLEKSPWLTIWKKSARKHYVVPKSLPHLPEQADITNQDQQTMQIE